MHNLPFAFCPCAITVCCGKVYKFQIISYSYLPNQWKFIRILSYPITLIYTHITLCRIPLEEGSARRRALYMKTHNTQKRDCEFQ